MSSLPLNSLPFNTMLGRLRTVEVLDRSDEPRLLITENASGGRYIAFRTQDQEENLWLYVSVSENRIASLMSGKVNLRTLYVDPEDGVLFQVRRLNEVQSSVDVIEPHQLRQDLLPSAEEIQISGEGFFAEHDFVMPQETDTLTHEITIHRSGTSGGIAFEALASVAANWSKLIHTILNVPPVAVEVSLGSFTVKLQTEPGGKLPTFLNTLRSLVAAPTPERISKSLSHQECKALELFLEALHKDKLTLSTTILSTPKSPFLVLSHSSVRELRLALVDLNQQRLGSAEVPQADDINKVFKMLELIQAGEENLGYHLSLSPRHVNYYKHAARTLGLLNENGSLTSRGHYLLSLSLLDRYEVAMLLFEGSPVGLAWLRYCGVKFALNLNPETAEEFLRVQCSDLSSATVGRRAQTLRYWVATFQEQLKD